MDNRSVYCIDMICPSIFRDGLGMIVVSVRDPCDMPSPSIVKEFKNLTDEKDDYLHKIVITTIEEDRWLCAYEMMTNHYETVERIVFETTEDPQLVFPREILKFLNGIADSNCDVMVNEEREK